MTDARLVHVVDDDGAVRRSASFILKTSGYKVCAHESGEAFLKAIGSAEPGCVLLDVRMPGLDGLQVQTILAERGLALPVIILTGHGDVSIAIRAMKAGAVDLIEKPFDKSVLLDAIEVAFRRLEDAVGVGDLARSAAIRVAALTPREQAVLRGMARGLPNKTIAHDLEISPRTVEVHRANLMAKLGVHSLSEALRVAFAASLHLAGPGAMAAESWPPSLRDDT